MSSFDPTSSSLDALEGRTLLISASAGTGKTWMTTHLATRWLLEVDDADPERLLMVTFSRRAAGELKSRLRQRVVDVLTALETGLVEGDDPWLEGLASGDPSDRLDATRKLRRVLARLGEVSARTIHSFASMSSTSLGSPTDGARLYERATNEAITRIALRDPSVLERLTGELPEGVKATPEIDSVAKLAKKATTTASRAAALGGLNHPEGSRAQAQMPTEGPLVETAADFLELVTDVERRAEALQTLERTSTFDSLISSLYWQVMAGGDQQAERLRQSFGFVLIDEFQDTDVAQWAIFERVFEGAVPVVIVGDPKQAIYGFRGGDVVIFQSLLSRAEAEPERYLVHSLETNYRSGERMLGQLNGLFLAGERAAPRFAAVPIGDSGPPERKWSMSAGDPGAGIDPIIYQPVKASPRRSNADDRSRLVIRNVTEKAELLGKGELASMDTYPLLKMDTGEGKRVNRLLYDDVADQIEEILGERTDLQHSDIVILCRTRSFITQLRDHLHERRIPAVVALSETVFASDAATQLRLVLWALADPTNPRRTGLLSWSWFRSHDHDDLRILAEALTLYGPGAMARRLLDVPTTAAILRSSNAQRNWTDLDHLIELLSRAQPFGVTPSVALRWLEDSIAGAEDLDEDAEVTRRIESDGGPVTIMTIHSAKGLEYPVVLVPQIERPGRKANVLALSTPGKRIFDIAGLTGATGDDDSTAIRLARQQADESARLIYVALTRAEEQLVVWLSDNDRHTFVKSSAARIKVDKTSQWRMLAESPGQLDSDDVAALRATCDAIDAPFEAEASVERRVARDERGTGPAAGQSSAPITTSEEPGSGGVGDRSIPELAVDGITEIPRIDERLRRWSYSALDVHGAAGSPPAGLEETEDIDVGFDAGPLAEDVQDELEVRSVGRQLFGGHIGSIAGTAIHDVFEHVVGTFSSTETERLRDEVVAGFARAGLDLDRADEVTEEFARVLSSSLGESFAHSSLDGLVGGNRTACEMDFTLPLIGEGAPSDRLLELGQLVIALDPTGPFSDFFGSLAGGDPKFAQLFQGFLVGSIDLVAQVGDKPRFVILDYKNNLLSEATSYEPEGLKAEMGGSGYPLQALLYSVALHRLLAKRIEGYDPSVHLGGACYLYVRGPADPETAPLDGVVSWRFTPEVVTGVSDLLAGRAVAP